MDAGSSVHTNVPIVLLGKAKWCMDIVVMVLTKATRLR